MIDGVVNTKVGYANSIKENPTYLRKIQADIAICH